MIDNKFDSYCHLTSVMTVTEFACKFPNFKISIATSMTVIQIAIRMLISNNSSPSCSSSSLLEARFLKALKNNNYGDINQCIDTGVNPNCVDNEDGNTPLHSAVETDNIGLALRLLQMPNINIDAKNYYGLTPLHMSLKRSSLRMFKILLKNNANPNFTDVYGNTPLHTAARFKSITMAQLLFRHGAQPNILNMMMNTPLHVAVLEMPFLPMVKLLLEHGANINIECGHMPFFLQAVLYCQSPEEIEILLFLIENGIDMHKTDKITKRNALHVVATTCSSQVAILLIKYGIKLRSFDYLGKTPLDIAIDRGNFDLQFIFQHAETISILIKRLSSL